MPSILGSIPATVFRDGTPQKLTADEERQKREIYEKMNPRRRKFVDRIGYDNWDPFQKPNDPLDLRMDVSKRTTQQLVREFKTTPATLRALAGKGALVIAPRAARRDPLAGRRVMPTAPLALNLEQRAALEAIRAATKPVLLHGVTGSGKTEVYLQAIARVLEAGKGAIVLVPEISLTPQTVRRFAGRFGARVAVLHSALSDGERYDEWHRIRTGEARVVVGPRSAVFAPVRNLGLIVVDEEHDPSYKQDETPRYHARDVAVMRAKIEGRDIQGRASSRADLLLPPPRRPPCAPRTRRADDPLPQPARLLARP